MLQHYLTMALRSLAQSKAYALSNMFGLLAGLASCEKTASAKHWFIIVGAKGCLLLALLMPSPARTQTHRLPLTQTVREDLDNYIARVVRDTPLPGLAIAVVDRRGVLYMRGFGYRDLDRKLPVTPDTLFAAASTTKAFTTFTAATLVDRALIQWDTPIHARMPQFQLAEPTATQQVTLRHLLTHSSGLAFHDLLWYADTDMTRADLVRRLRYLAMVHPPGTHYQYNNLMFVAAAEYLHHVTGTPADQLIRRTIFAPLHMDRTTFSLSRMLRDPDHAIGYDYDYARGYHYGVRMRDMTTMAAAGGINSSVRDYAKWLMLQLNDGRVGGRALISPQGLTAIRTPRILISDHPTYPEFGPISYGMGWNVDTYRGMHRLHHSGLIDGFTSRITIYPEEGIGIVIFTNQSDNYVPSWLSVDIADRIFRLTPLNWVARIAAERRRPGSGAPPTALPPIALSLPIADYAGEYTNPAYGRLTISVDGNSLTARLNGVLLWLEPAGPDRFKTNTSTYSDRFFSELELAFLTDGAHPLNSLSFRLDPEVGPELFTRAVTPAPH